jgi:cell division protein FtsI (penicillin-binding protein 3)
MPLVAPVRRLRMVNVVVFFACWAAAIGLRLVWLQVVRHHDFVERAARQQQRTFEVAPRRGVLYDRNLNELAMTTLVDSIYAVPSEIASEKDPNAAALKSKVAAELAKVVHTDPTDRFTSAQQIHARLVASRNFAWVARKQDAATVARVKALGLKGVYTQKEFKRFYPNNQIAAQVLGYVGIDDNGLGGLEQEFDDDLHGTPGRMLTALDARRHVLGSEERDPLPGENLVLTIDENIQFMAERALDHAMEKFKPLNGTVVVQDPHTGQILALAMRPTFNPNDFRHATRDLLKDHAVSDVYEPGSTFKLVTYSAAIEEKKTRPDELIDCQGGKITLFGRTIHDSHLGTGVITVEQALWKSSDVAAVKLALRMGSDTFYKYMRAYGFGDRSGVELPAETRGLLRPTRKWGATSIGSLAIGQEVGVTPVQLVTMVSTIANGGTYLPPHILLKSTDEVKGSKGLKPVGFHPGTELPSPLPEGAHRVISTMTSAEMRKMMEGIVLFGTGRSAALNGYSAGGKTGTAQKIDVRTHTYSKTKYVASFAGFAPINNPAVSIAVIIDSPEGAHMGAQVSGPVFQELAQQILEYLGVPHDVEMKSPALVAKEKQKDASDQALDEKPDEDTSALETMFAEVNDLPADDPLRSNAQSTKQAVPVAKNDDGSGNAGTPSTGDVAGAGASPPAPKPLGMAAAAQTQVVHAQTKPQESEVAAAAPAPMPAQVAAQPAAASKTGANGSVVVNASKRVSVPSFAGQSVRGVIEQAGHAGLGVKVLGTGIARAQAPAAGTLVPEGTDVVVRFTR